MSWQPLLIERIKALGYKFDEKGICFGLAQMAMQACLVNDFDSFEKRLNDLYNTPVETLKNLESAQLVNYRAFIEGMILYQKPYVHDDLFKADSAPKKQRDRALMEPLVRSQALQEQGGAAELISFTGIYSLEELTTYFKLLQESTTKPHQIQSPLSLILENHNHAINISYNPQNKENPWVLVDANQGKIQYYKGDNDIAKAAMNALFSTNTIAFSSRIYSTEHNKTEQQKVVDNWINHDEWKKMHTVSDKFHLTDDNKVSWLDIAVRHSDLEHLNLLINEPYINLNTTLVNQQTPLFSAVASGNVEIVNRLLEDNRVEPNARRADGSTPLIIAGEINNKEIIVTLLANKRVNAKLEDTNSHQSPLHVAAMRGYVQLAKALIERTDIDPNETNRYGLTPLYLAIQNNHPSIVNALLPYATEQLTNNKNNLFTMAAKNEEPAILEAMLSIKNNINSSDSSGQTPLIGAAMAGNNKVVDFLLNRPDIKPNKTHPNGMAALNVAVYRGHTDVVKSLISRMDVDVNQGPDGNSSLHLAIEFGQVEIVKLLLQRKDIDFTQKYNGKTALELALEKETPDIANRIREAMTSTSSHVKNSLGFFATASTNSSEQDNPSPTTLKINK